MSKSGQQQRVKRQFTSFYQCNCLSQTLQFYSENKHINVRVIPKEYAAQQMDIVGFRLLKQKGIKKKVPLSHHNFFDPQQSKIYDSRS